MRRIRSALGIIAGLVCCTAALAALPPRFTDQAVWNQDISLAPLNPQSASLIATVASLGGFGNGRMQIDFGMRIVQAPIGSPTRTIIGFPSNNEYYAPDCEPVGTTMPVPTSAQIEGSANLSCDNNNEDCHLLVVQGNVLYEAYRANMSGTSGLQAQCLAMWKLDGLYPASNRGEHCTSADAAGFPIAALLFNADEVYAAMQVADADLGHALRFILPNARMASLTGSNDPVYVRPASHAGGPSGPEASVAYGSRLRLRSDFPLNLYSAAAQVILRTMQRYGIVLADGGNIALTAESDVYTTHKWAELGIDSRVFDLSVPSAVVRIQDFAVIDTGARIVETYNCVLNAEPITVPTLSIADVLLSEGNSGTKVATFTVTLSTPAPTGGVTFNIATANLGNAGATAGSDYVARSLTGQNIAAGLSSKTFTVTINGDTSNEPDERFAVDISNVVNADVLDGHADGTILNDDGARLSIADTSVTEGNSGTKLATFTVSLSAPAPTGGVTFNITTTNAIANSTPKTPATAGSDYVARTLTGQNIAAGLTSKTFDVTINGDTAIEGNETFSVTVSNVVNADVSDSLAFATIFNDDGVLRYRASATSPFLAGCDGVPATGTVYVNAEVEPQVAVNPVDSSNIIGVWQQDRWSNGGSRGVMTGTSFDGGVTWSQHVLPFSRCGGGTVGNGGDYERATDPWVTFAPDGTAYQMALSFSGGALLPGSASAMLVSRSVDGGVTWGNTIALIRDGSQFFNDKNSMTADPANANFVYAVWDRVTTTGSQPIYFSRTSNGGLSWETARSIYDPGVNSATLGSVIVVLPNGTLVNSFVRFDTVNGSLVASLFVIRSTDKGLTWSAPIKIADDFAIGASDPETGTPIRDGAELSQIAVGPTGTLFVVWQDSRFSNGVRDGIALSRSFDGGLTWSVPSRINTVPSVQAFTPTVHVRADGMVGVSYYDLRNNSADPTTLLTDYWLDQSPDSLTWQENYVSGSFDLAIAPNAGGLFLGDYQGLASIGTIFVPFFAQTNNGNLGNRTDIFAMLASATTSDAPSLHYRASAPHREFFTTQISPQLKQRVHDSIVRTMERRIPGWYDAMRRRQQLPPLKRRSPSQRISATRGRDNSQTIQRK